MLLNVFLTNNFTYQRETFFSLPTWLNHCQKKENNKSEEKSNKTAKNNKNIALQKEKNGQD